MRLSQSQSEFVTRLFCLLLTIAILAMSGCGGGGSSPAPTLTSLNISSPKSSVDLGLTVQLSVTGTYSNGSTRDLSNVAAWMSSANTIATVNTTGLVTSLSQGSVIISASYSGVSNNFALAVGPAVLQRIDLTPANGSVPLGRTQQFTATGKYTDGTTQVLSDVSWSSSASNVAAISSSGLLSSKAIGSTTITATSGSISGSTSFAVAQAALVSIELGPTDASVPAGLTLQLTATGIFTDNSQKALSGLNWSSSDTELASVGSDGNLASHHQGNVTITASAGQVSGTESVQITAPLLTGISLNQTSAAAYMGASSPTSLEVTGTYTDDSTADVSANVTWNYSIPFIASIDSNGVVQPKRLGFTEAWATLETFSTGRASVAVLSHPRYAFIPSGSNQAIDRATLSETGQLRWAGTTPTNAGNSIFDCATLDPDSNYIYVAHTVPPTPYSGRVEIYRVDADRGTTSSVVGSPVAVASPVGCITFEPTAHFGYASSTIDGAAAKLITFQRSTTSGTIAQVNETSLPGYPSVPAIDPTGRYLYVTVTATDFTEAYAYGYAIDAASGSLSPIEGTPFEISRYAGSFSFHPGGKYVYLANTQAASIDAYSIDISTGKLTFVNSISTCVNPSKVRFSLVEGNPAGPFAYSSCSMNTNHDANSGSVQAYSVLSNGSLLLINSAPSDAAVSDFEINSAGNALYSAGLNYISAYSLNKTTGEITLLAKFGSHPSPTSIVLTGGSTSVAYSPDLAIVASTGDNQITSYNVTTDGMLTNPQSVAASTEPFALSALPWGRQVLVASAAPKPALSSYLLNAGGGLQFVRNFGESSTSSGVALDPSGIWALDVDSTNDGVHLYGDAGQLGLWGTLTPSFYATGSNPGPIAIDSVGRFIFVGNRNSNSITVFERSAGWISLAEMTSTYTGPYVDGSPYALPASPLQLAVDQYGNLLYARCSDNAIRVFSIDYSSRGHLMPAASTTLAGVGAGLAVIPMSNAFVAADTNGLHAFTLNPSTKIITEGDSVSLTNVNGVYADPASGIIYATTSTTDNGAIYAFTADSSGHLVPVANNPVATSNQPSSMTFKSLIQ